MQFKKWGMIGTAIWSAWLVSVSTGCASGGWKLTRDYARFVNRQPIIIRCVLYILTSFVFVATMLIDAVIFNTIDFWQGRVSQGTFEFNKEGRRFVARHTLSPETHLRESRIEVFESDKRVQDMILREVAGGQIDIFVDGVLKGRVDNIESAPLLSFYNKSGEKTGSELMFQETIIARAAQ